MSTHDTDQVLFAAVYAAVARTYDNERSIEDAADEILDAIEADRQRRGEPVEDGWRLIAVNEVWDALERALNRACSKGYMPDAIGEEWNAFDWTEAPQPAEPVKVNAIFETQNGE